MQYDQFGLSFFPYMTMGEVLRSQEKKAFTWLGKRGKSIINTSQESHIGRDLKEDQLSKWKKGRTVPKEGVDRGGKTSGSGRQCIQEVFTIEGLGIKWKGSLEAQTTIQKTLKSFSTSKSNFPISVSEEIACCNLKSGYE